MRRCKYVLSFDYAHLSWGILKNPTSLSNFTVIDVFLVYMP